MILPVLHALHRFDGWLDRSLGPPYRLLIGIGLIIEIIRHVVEISHTAAEPTYLIRTALTLLLYVALLLHTADALYERMARRAMRRGTLPGRH